MNAVIYNAEYPRRLRTAFIGCGGHAQRNILPAFAYAPVDLVAICDLDRARAEGCARMFGACAVYTDHAEMQAREKPEVVFIVTNYDEEGRPRYPKLACEALRAGSHVWIEKPPAASLQDIHDMQTASAEAGRHIGVGFKKMFFPATQKARELSRLASFGEITSITARYPQSLPALEKRDDLKLMNGFLDHMVHPHSLLKYLVGDIESLFVRRHAGTESAMVSLRFKSGAVGNLHFCAGMSSRSFLERTEIVGEGENIVIENNLRVTYYRRPTTPVPYGRTGDAYTAGLDEAPLVWEPEFSLGQLYNKGLFLLGYAPEIIHFTSRLLEGQPPELGTLADALEMMRIYEAYGKADEQIVPV